jgi:hypothetical protein
MEVNTAVVPAMPKNARQPDARQPESDRYTPVRQDKRHATGLSREYLLQVLRVRRHLLARMDA